MKNHAYLKYIGPVSFRIVRVLDRVLDHGSNIARPVHHHRVLLQSHCAMIVQPRRRIAHVNNYITDMHNDLSQRTALMCRGMVIVCPPACPNQYRHT